MRRRRCGPGRFRRSRRLCIGVGVARFRCLRRRWWVSCRSCSHWPGICLWMAGTRRNPPNPPCKDRLTDPDLLTARQRAVAYLLTAVVNGALIPVQATVDRLPLWALSVLGGWNALVAVLALNNTPTQED